MEILDIIIIVVGIAALIRGYVVGLIGRLGSLAAIILATIAARLIGPAVFERWGLILGTQSESLGLILSYALVFVLCYFGVRLTARLIRNAVRTVHLGFLDRAAGSIFSLLEWMLALSFVMNIYAALSSSGDSLFTGPGHALRQAVYNLAPMAIGYIKQLNLLS